MNEASARFLAPFLVVLVCGSASAQSGAAPAEPAGPTAGTVIDARTAVKLALQRNPTRQAADIDVQRAQQSVLAQEGAYPYIFQADAGYTRSRQPRLGIGDTVTSSTSRSYTLGSAIRRTFPFGTTAEVRLQGERFETDGSPSPDGYGVTARAALTQPLLRGAGTGVGEAELRAARISKQLADRTRTRATSVLVRDVLLSYWELWYADEAIAIERNALELAKRQEKEADVRVQAGAAAKADLLSFSTRVAQLEESVVQAETTKEQRALDLGRLISAEDASNLTAAREEPTVGKSPTRADIESALRAGSVELAELETQVKLARSRAEYAGDASRPRLDLEAYLESNGVSERVPKAFERTGRMSWLTAHVGLVFEMPLDDSRRNADRQSALLAVRSAEQSLKAARDRISADAALTMASERAAVRRLALAQRTLELAEKTHEAEKVRFELGQSIAIQVQEAEDAVRQAKLRVTRARVDLTQEQIGMLHLSGRLLQSMNGG
jgi:outer membrane protein TolC